MWRSVGEVKVSCNGCERVEGDANVVRRQGGQTSFEVHVESEGDQGKRSPRAAAAWSGERINRHSRWRSDRRDDRRRHGQALQRRRQNAPASRPRVTRTKKSGSPVACLDPQIWGRSSRRVSIISPGLRLSRLGGSPSIWLADEMKATRLSASRRCVDKIPTGSSPVSRRSPIARLKQSTFDRQPGRGSRCHSHAG